MKMNGRRFEKLNELIGDSNVQSDVKLLPLSNNKIRNSASVLKLDNFAELLRDNSKTQIEQLNKSR